MSEYSSAAARRLSQIGSFFRPNKRAMTIPWNPDSTEFPTRNELPKIEGAPEGAAWVWGKDDFVRESFQQLNPKLTLLDRSGD